MNKINLLKPNMVTGFLEDGRGQEITYLDVNPYMTRKNLEEDIENGAVHLKDVLDIMNKKPSRFVVIKCRTKEEGLTAVSYLASSYNKADGVEGCYSESDCDGVSRQQTVTFADLSGEYPEDYEEDLEGPDFDMCEPEEDWEAGASWEESPWRIPVVNMSDLVREDDEQMHMFFGGDKSYRSMGAARNRVPYWKYTRRENFCIWFDACPSIFDGGTVFNEFVLKRYENNRHVFLLVIDRFAEERMSAESDEESGFSPDVWYESMLARVILNYSAEIVSIHHSDEDIQTYHENLFENWVHERGYSLEEGFPVKDITRRIVAMDDDSKSQLIERVIRYATKDIEEPRTLTEDDFKILYKLKGLGYASRDEEREHVNLKKLSNSLVGMEDIKDQIRNIVEVFKYNKLRGKMGLKTGTYHNVHMMLGAPGTAKTTVAQLLGNIMAEERLLRGNTFISVNGAELKGMFVGHSAPKVKKLFEENDIIFIDEAYSVCAGADGHEDSFSQEAIAQLIIELENHGMDRLVIFAGYGGPNVSSKDNKMIDFLNSNPGIRSRINSTMFFDSYDADQMTKIFRGLAKTCEFIVPKSADKYVHDYFADRCGMEDFGNGREARSLLENAAAEAARRISSVPAKDITKDQLRQITANDVRRAVDKMRRAQGIQRGMGKFKLGF